MIERRLVAKSRKAQVRAYSLNKELPQHRLNYMLRYEPETGKIYWKTAKEMHETLPEDLNEREKNNRMAQMLNKRRNQRYGGKEAFTYWDKGSSSYKGTLAGYNLTRQMVIWALLKGEWPDFFLEFVDGDSSNTRIENIRPKTGRVKESVTPRERKFKLSDNEILEYFGLADGGRDVVWRKKPEGPGFFGSSYWGEPAFDKKNSDDLYYCEMYGIRVFKHEVAYFLHNGVRLDGPFMFKDGDTSNTSKENIVLLNPPQD